MGELHIMTGVTNYLLKQCEKLDIENLQAWLQSCGLRQKGAHGDFNGNDCKKILCNSRQLEI